MKQFETHEELIYALIIDDLDGSISPENKLILDRWRAEGADHESTYQEFLAVQQSMDKLYDKNTYDAQVSWESLDRKITTAGDPIATVSPKRKARLWYSIAAALFMSCAIGYYFMAGRYVVVSTDEHSKITRVVLPDGTALDLNAATKIRYHKRDFEDDRKLELLNGEVFIHVIGHTASQFRVDMGEVEAWDIGTSFNVTRNAEKIAVIVEEGKVVLKHHDLNQEVLLTAGKIGVYDLKKKSLVAADNLNANYKAWIDKSFIFHELPIVQVAAQLGETYRVPVEIRGAQLRDRKLTARLSYQTVDSVLAVISASLQCSVTKEKDVYVLSDN